MRLLITGGCGFIGTNFIRLVLEQRPDISLVNLDALSYAANPANFENLPQDQKSRYQFIKADICDAAAINSVLDAHGFDAIINFAAQTHVDRSIMWASPFVTANALGVQVLLDAARRAKIKRFVQISTDEVYGSLKGDFEDSAKFSENTPLAPNSPYSASKAAGDMLVRAANKTFGLNTIITRCSNNYGPWQFPEKLIPLMIHKALKDEKLPVYGDGMHIRDWIHVADHSRGILLALEHGQPGAVYNFGGNCEKTNLDVINTLLDILNKPASLICHVKDRPGHDRRYAMDYSLAKKELGYEPQKDFMAGLKETVDWYLDNKPWVDNIICGEYRNFASAWYAELAG